MRRILRHPGTTAPFSRYAAFIAANPQWPSAPLLRRRAESRLWEQRSDAATVRGFTGDRPATAKGKLALARVLLAEGDRDGAARLARDAWRSDELSERLETDVLETFRDLLTRDDHRARMDRRIGAKDLAGAKRAAQRLGGDELAIVKACAAVKGKADKAKDTLDDVAVEARQDLGYTLCRIQWMLAQNRIDEARGALGLLGSNDPQAEIDELVACVLEGRDTSIPNVAALQNRGLVVKINKLLRL